MRPYGFDTTHHVLDDCDVSGCSIQGAPTHLAGGRIRNKAKTRRTFARRARQAGKHACNDRD